MEKILLVTTETLAETRAASDAQPGRFLALDLGSKRVGVALCDELRLTVRPLPAIPRRSWKDLLSQVKEQVRLFEAKGLVIGLPVNLDGTEGAAAVQARETADKFRLSLDIPVFLEDERLTTEEARSRLQFEGRRDIEREVDSAAAAIILQDFLNHLQS